MKLSYQDVKEILAILDASPFDEMKLETDGLKLALRRSSSGAMEIADTQPAEAEKAARKTEEKPRPDSDKASAKPAEKALADDLVEIRAPMLGIFYCSPKPGAEPFIQVGQKVEEQTVVCIIEVMKLMNSVEAKVTGEVVEVCAKDGDLVEYDQVLFRVKA